jgi:hypothetical protein
MASHHTDGVTLLQVAGEYEGVPSMPFRVTIPAGIVDDASSQMGFVGKALPASNPWIWLWLGLGLGLGSGLKPWILLLTYHCNYHRTVTCGDYQLQSLDSVPFHPPLTLLVTTCRSAAVRNHAFRRSTLITPLTPLGRSIAVARQSHDERASSRLQHHSTPHSDASESVVHEWR